jgi:O-acetylhomoserine/O-acetylserine sulfhydrylase-like pyridoxal-dependent enzyme
MKSKTIAIHSGYEVNPSTKAVAAPIYHHPRPRANCL